MQRDVGHGAVGGHGDARHGVRELYRVAPGRGVVGVVHVRGERDEGRPGVRESAASDLLSRGATGVYVPVERTGDLSS